MSSLSERTTPRGRVVRGRDADVTHGVQRTNASVTTAGGLELDRAVAEHIHQEAHKAGFDAGYADGLRAAERQAMVQEVQRTQEIEAVRRCFGDATQAYERALGQALADLEDALATASLMLAEAIIGRELAVAENPGKDAIVRALALAPQQFPMTARCNPDDVEHLGDPRALFGDRDLTVIADPAVEAGGCILQVGRSEIDAQLSTAVERARTVLCG